jgi:hypothetical protein
MSNVVLPEEYATLPLERWTLVDMTDAIGVPETAVMLKTTRRAVYTFRSTKTIALPRIMQLIDKIKSNEKYYRSRLITLRTVQLARAARHKEITT